MTAPKAPAVPGMPAFHSLANIDPMIEGADFAALVEDIRTHRLNEPIVLYQGKILDGRNRARACAEAGVEPHYKEMAFGSDAEAKAFLDSANLHRRHLTPKQKRDRIAARLKADPTQSDRQIAKQTGASHPHVAKVRHELEQSGAVETVTAVTGSDKRQQPRQRSKPAKAKPVADAEPASPATNPDGIAEPAGGATASGAIKPAATDGAVTAPASAPAAKTPASILIRIADLARGCRGLLAHPEQNVAEIREKLAKISRLRDPDSKGRARAPDAAKTNAKLDQKLFPRAMALDGTVDRPNQPDRADGSDRDGTGDGSDRDGIGDGSDRDGTGNGSDRDGTGAPVRRTGNDVDTQQSADERRVVNEAMAMEDDLPIPECLLRNKGTAS